jgi:hypothetical protein
VESLYLPILVMILFFKIFGGGKDARGGGMQAAGGSLGFYHRSELQSLQSLPTHAAKILVIFFWPLTLGRACQGPSAHSARNSDARSRRLNSGDGSESRTWNPGKLLFGLLSRLLFGLGQGIPTRTHAARRRL